MNKFIIIALITMFAYTSAQRPSYAGSLPIGRPDLHSRFKDTTETTTVDLSNRVGDDATTPWIPVDARGDTQLVDRLNQWPRENRPFWLINAEQIEAARNPTPGQQLENRNNFQGEAGTGTIPIRPTAQRSSFLKPLN